MDIDEASRARAERFGTVRSPRRRIGTGPAEATVFVDYQPIVLQAAPVAFEALLREVDEQGRVRGPAAVLAGARAQGHLAELDATAVERALAGAAPWLDGRLLFVNVAPLPSRLQRGHLDRLVEVVRHSPVPAHDVVLEVHEHQPQLAELTSSFTRVRAVGVGLALDDVTDFEQCRTGTRHVGPRWIKVDGSLVDGLGPGRTWRQLEQVIDCAQRAGATVIAERVETRGQSRQLAQMGIDHQQGFWPDRLQDGGAPAPRPASR